MRFGLMQQKKGTLGISLGEGILNILFSSSQYKDLRLQKGKVSDETRVTSKKIKNQSSEKEM